MTIRVEINDAKIGTVGISNVGGRIGVDDVNAYEWAYFGDGERKLVGRLEHRYGDGAIVLASKVLAEIALRYQVAGSYTAKPLDRGTCAECGFTPSTHTHADGCSQGVSR